MLIVSGNRQHYSQSGFTIVELMISMTLGLIITAIVAGLLASSKASYATQDDSIELQETGRFAVEIIARAVRQAGFQPLDETGAPLVMPDHASPDIMGFDARSLKANSVGLDVVEKNSINNSDVLALRFFGAGTGANGDGTIVNCAGFGIAAPLPNDVEEGRGWSIFYVAADSTGEPELRCKYKGKTAWTSEAIARGIESFQVLYGVDMDADGLSERFLRADEIEAMDDALILNGPNAQVRYQDRQTRSHWRKVVAVKVALLLRGTQNVRSDVMNKQYALFGQTYCDHRADKDSCLMDDAFPVKLRGRLRKIFATTILIRNQSAISHR